MSAMTLFSFIALLGGASAVITAQDEGKNRPVSKVITLLKDMVTQLEKEAAEDEDIYEGMACWCETNDKLKTQAIADGKQRVVALTAAIEEGTAKSARLNTEVGGLNKEVAKSQQTLDTATALRAKGAAEFHEAEKDLLSSITSLKGAIVSLSKHNKGAALLQSTDRETLDVLATLSDQMARHPDIVAEGISSKQRKVLKAFVQQDQSYAPQSNEIFGILQAMGESFETNLATSQKEEASAITAFQALKAAKTDEIQAGQDQIDAKTEELANTDEKLVNDKQDKEDTENTLAEDIKFLADLKDKCANVDQDYEERTKTRQLEIGAVSKALEFLSSDEAHDLFTSTFNPKFVQTRSQADERKRAKIVKVLEEAAQKHRDPRLSTLAVSAKMDAFGNLKKTIQTMVDRLLKEKEDEIKQKDFCVEQFNENSRDTELKTTEKEETEAEINDLKMTVDTLTKDIEELKMQVAELQDQMKRAGQDREKENKNFQVEVADQRATQTLLGKALDVLKGFYAKAALVQAKKQAQEKRATRQAQAPPPGFKSYEKNEKSGGVMGMIESIISEAKALEAEAVRGEEDAQKAYEDFVMDTNAAVDGLQTDITNKTQEKGKAEGDQLDAEVELDHIMESLHQLSVENNDIHRSCDFLMKNYEVRSAARDQEIEALKQAIALFSGAKMAALLESK